MATLSVYKAAPAEGSLAPHNLGARDYWLGRLGPTAMWTLVVLHDTVEHLDAGEVTVVEMTDLADYLGVKPSVLVKALERLHRYQACYFDAASNTVMSDFRLADRTHQSTRLITA